MEELPQIPSDISVSAREPKRPKRRLRVFDRVVWWLNVGAAFLLLLSYFAPGVNPTRFWPIAFLGLGYLVLAGVNLLFVFYFLLRRRRRALLSVLVLILGWPALSLSFCFFSDPADTSLGSFKVMSYNTRLFDLYNWSHNEKTRAKMFALLQREKPELLCLQEFYERDGGENQNLDTLKKLLNLPYVHVEYTLTIEKSGQHFGIATYSKYPIVTQGSIIFNNRSNNICIYTDILLDKDTVRVYNMHLQSIRFGYADHRFLNAVVSGEDAKDELENSKNILRRIKRGFTRRAGQAQSIAAHMASCPYPKIVCGDFNDTPISYTYHTISKGMDDAFLESGQGIGKTYSTAYPLPRIDYILHSPFYEGSGFEVIREELSDHYPIVCRLKKRPAE